MECKMVYMWLNAHVASVVDTKHLHKHANLHSTISSKSSFYENLIYFTTVYQHKLTLTRLSLCLTKELFEVAKQPQGAPYEYSSSQN